MRGIWSISQVQVGHVLFARELFGSHQTAVTEDRGESIRRQKMKEERWGLGKGDYEGKTKQKNIRGKKRNKPIEPIEE